MEPLSSPHVFKVRRCESELITPSRPTPHEFKPLSDIDDQQSFRFQLPFISVYRHNASTKGKDPVKIIRNAIADALVYYYPFAGRLRERPGNKLVVDCNGEGVIFIEANADVRLDDFGDDALQPPFSPWLEELLYEDPASGGVLDCPLLLFQVTRFMCGGFIIAFRYNHTMSDASGLTLFLSAVVEMAQGATTPSIMPTWQRELLNARDPPQITCVHHEYDEVLDTGDKPFDLNDMSHRCFFFGRQEITALKSHAPHITCSSFDILTACLWRSRTIAINPNPEGEVRFLFAVNARGKYCPPLPVGYYGNVFALPAASTTAGKLCRNPISYALQLVKDAKESVTEEYMRSLADMMVIKGRPLIGMVTSRTYIISDNRHARFKDMEFGWGKAVFAGVAEGDLRPYPGGASFLISHTNSKGEDGILVPICLPRHAMENFEMEIQRLILGASSSS